MLKNPRSIEVRGEGEPEEKEQRLWPVHCVQGTEGAEVIEEIERGKVQVWVKKGMDERMEMQVLLISLFCASFWLSFSF